MATVIEARPYDCGYCDYVGKTDRQIRVHRTTSHPVHTRYLTCPYCGKVFHNHVGVYRSHVNAHETMSERFWAQVDINGPVPDWRPDLGPCWLWTGFAIAKGYGLIHTPDRSTKLASTFAYEDAGGFCPDGWDVDHLCRVPLCVNPHHLEAVTHEENMRRAFEAQREIKYPCDECAFVALGPAGLMSHRRFKHPSTVNPSLAQVEVQE